MIAKNKILSTTLLLLVLHVSFMQAGGGFPLLRGVKKTYGCGALAGFYLNDSRIESTIIGAISLFALGATVVARVPRNAAGENSIASYLLDASGEALIGAAVGSFLRACNNVSERQRARKTLGALNDENSYSHFWQRCCYSFGGLSIPEKKKQLKGVIYHADRSSTLRCLQNAGLKASAAFACSLAGSQVE